MVPKCWVPGQISMGYAAVTFRDYLPLTCTFSRGTCPSRTLPNPRFTA
jgi:hypothetical protein